MEERNKRYVFRIFNLPDDTTEQELADLVNTCVPVKKVWVAVQDGQCMGFAFVEFHNQEDMDIARQVFSAYVWKSTLLYCIP